MNVGQVHGPGGLGPSHERPHGKRRQDGTEVPPRVDVADISARAHAIAESLEDLAKQVQDQSEDRRELIEDAKRRLESGHLDQQEVYRRTAERMLQLDSGDDLA